MIIKVLRLVAPMVLILGLVSCGSDGKPSASPSSSTATAEPKPIGALDSPRLKEGRDYTVVRSLPTKLLGLDVSYNAITPDGVLAGVISTPMRKDIDMGEVGSRSSVILYRPSTKKTTRVSDGSRRPKETQAFGTVANQDWVTWFETPQTTIGISDWTLYAYDRSTKVTHTLTTGNDPLIVKDSSLHTGPYIQGDRGLFGTGGPRATKGKGDNVYSIRLDGSGKLDVAVPNVNIDNADDKSIRYFSGNRLMSQDAASGRTRVLADPVGDCGSEADSLTVVTCTEGGSSKAVLHLTRRGAKTEVLGPFGESVGYLELAPSWLSFNISAEGINDSQQLYNLDRKKQFRMPAKNKSVVFLSGDQALLLTSDGSSTQLSQLIKLK